ncbi:MAG: group 1 truncated hemoglobin [Deltaproteobacteria bacterium]|nr:group 1 truncated hemoglobin [Deltaproteobacteria bacterium]
MSSLFDRVGGRFAILGMLRSFYDSVFSDPMIGFLFRASDKERLIDREYALVAAALGVEEPYAGRPLEPTHARFKITGGQFERRLVLLEAAMTRCDFPREAVSAVLAHNRGLRSLITKDPGSDCHPT